MIIISNKSYDVVVVGAGMAGLTAAAYLSKDGHSVVLIEKERKNGGLVGSFVIDGHQVDYGARGIIDSGIFTPMIRQLGLDVTLLPNPIRIAVGNQAVDFTGPSCIDEYSAMLSRLYPDHKGDIDKIIKDVKRVIGYMDVLYGIENPLFLPKPYDYRYLALTLLPWTVRLVLNVRQAMKLLDPINTHLRKLTSNESLIHIITQHFFADTPTFFALSYFSLYRDYLYPQGSTQSLVDSLVRVIEKNGGLIHNGQDVVSINAEKREVCTKQGQRYSYRQLIWAADLNVLYTCLAPELWADSPLKQEVCRKKAFLSSKRGADSVLSVHIVVDLPPDNFRDVNGPHAFYTPSPQGLAGISLMDLRDEDGRFTGDIERIFVWLENFVKYNTLEISIPALRDPSLSPPGQCALIVSLLFDYFLTKHIADLGVEELFKAKITRLIIEALGGYFTDFSKHVLKTVVTTPLKVAAMTYATEGSLTGWSFTNDPFPAEYRFFRVSKSVLTPIKSIKQAGQWAFNPAGVPVSVLTGKLAADAVAKELRVKTRRDA